MAISPDRETDLFERVSQAMAAKWPGAEVHGLRTLTGGSSGLTYVAQVADGRSCQQVVVKTIPAGRMATANRDVVRQARLCQALASGGLPVPEVLWVEAGDPPELPPFMVSRYVEGDSYDPTSWTESGSSTSAEAPPTSLVAARAGAAMGVLARLQRSEAALACLDQGQAATPASEVARWWTALATTPYASHPLASRCVEELEAAPPSSLGPVLVHGDFRLGNMLCVGDEVRAVIDWEIWSAGDPRLDLAWFVARACPTHPCARPDRPLPAARSLLDRYLEYGGHEPGDLAWFRGAAAFKHAAAAALIEKRGGAAGDERSRRVPELLRWALDQLA